MQGEYFMSVGDNCCTLGDSLSHQPQDADLIAHYEGTHLVNARPLAVGEIVADKLRSLHTEGLKTVTVLHRTHDKTALDSALIKDSKRLVTESGNGRTELASHLHPQIADCCDSLSYERSRKKRFGQRSRHELSVVFGKDVAALHYVCPVTGFLHLHNLVYLKSLYQQLLTKSKNTRFITRFKHRLRLHQMRHGLCQRPVYAGIDGPQQGEKLVPHLVATVVRIGIAAVIDKGLVVARQVVKNLGTGRGQQRTEDALVILKTHSGQSMQPGTPYQIEEHRLHIVIGMVGNTDGGRMAVFTVNARFFVLKPIIAQTTGSHLDALTMKGSLSMCVKTNDTETYAMTSTETSHELFVTLTLLTTKLEVAMEGDDLIVELLKDVNEGDAISPSAQATQHGTRLWRVTVCRKQLLNVVEK